MIGKDDGGDGMRVLCVRRSVVGWWSGHVCGYDAGVGVERATGAAENDDEDDGGERRGKVEERREEEMRDKKGVNFPNKWAGLDLVAELIAPA